MKLCLPAPLRAQVDSTLEEWRRQKKVRRLWDRDSSLWTGKDENAWLGWLEIIDQQLARVGHLETLAAEVRGAGFEHAIVLGMGGSSLCPEVLKSTFGKIEGSPELHVLDSTDPSQIRSLEAGIDLGRTLFIVSSKSGGTLEPNIFKQYFYERVSETVGSEKAGSHFIAVTDPGSKLQGVSERDGFRRLFFGVPNIGGRYSALSDFGMVPAAIMGLNVRRFLERARAMVRLCAPETPESENPGLCLGIVLGMLGRAGKDKITLVVSPGIRDLGAWLEQLLAESTGKLDKALIPVDGENLGAPEVYGKDRLFVYLRLENAPDPDQDVAVDRLESDGRPVVRIPVAEPGDLGQELFRWEFATAVAGSIMGVNPFDQPDVDASKVATQELTSEFEQKGSLPPEKVFAEEAGIKLYAQGSYARALAGRAGSSSALETLRSHVRRLEPGDYFALLAYVEMCPRNQKELQAIRHKIRDEKRVATCLGYGPRFLHSTGQAYKGGPNTGVFLQITCDEMNDLPVPGRKYTFGVVKAAQARGDFKVLGQRKRRALRVHLSGDLMDGLRTLRKWIDQSLP